MTREELWQKFIDRNPAMREDVVRLKTTSLRKMFDLIWDTAASARTRETGGNHEPIGRVPRPLRDIFDTFNI